MKKALLLLPIALVFMAQSCKTDDSDVFIESPLLGFWTITQYTVTNPIDLNNDGVISNDLLLELPCYNAVYNFLGDGSFNTTSASILIVTTVDEQEVEMIEGFCDGSETLSGIWDLEDTILTLTMNDITFSQVIEITDATLTLRANSSFGQETLIFKRL